jgi:hypothetical protein
MRLGVQRTGVRCGMNWNDKKLKDQAWYLDSIGAYLKRSHDIFSLTSCYVAERCVKAPKNIRKPAMLGKGTDFV